MSVPVRRRSAVVTMVELAGVWMLLVSCCTSWTTSPSLVTNRLSRRSSSSSSGGPLPRLFAVELNTPEVNAGLAASEDVVKTEEGGGDDDDDEYEYVEYDNLTEQEFIGSEWLVGTNWDRRPDKIDETWARLVVDASGRNVVVWGDQSEGVWSIDVAAQFLSLSKENIVAGKEIWACTVSDYYYLQGTVRAWKYWSAAAVIGQWQAKRLGVGPGEAGTPPWFEVPTPEQ